MITDLTWREALQRNSYRIQFLVTVAALLFIAVLIPQFFLYIQERGGYVLNDPVLNLLTPAQNFSVLIFTLIYSALITAIISFSIYPLVLLRAMQAYCLLTTLRVLSVLLIPLNDPPGIIVLNDPFVQILSYGGKAITKDLFFSGHVSTLFLLFLAAPKRWLKYFFLIITLIVATCILIQHVHYTIDVLAAPVFSWICYKIFFSIKKFEPR